MTRRIAVIDATGAVVNVVEIGGVVPPTCTEDTAPKAGFSWVESDIAGPGWTHNGSRFTAPVEPPRIPIPLPLEPDASSILRALVKKGVITVAEARAEIRGGP